MSSGNVVKSLRHEQALRYARAGVPVFPCLVDGKEPAVANGFHARTTDEARINEWWDRADYNIGIVPADAGYFVVDLDPGANANDLHLPPTHTIETPRGGKHLYYATDLQFGNSTKLGKHIDVRSANGYVLAYPSIVNGRQYRVLVERDAEDLPASIVERLNQVVERKLGAVEELDFPVNVERARAFLEHAAPAIEGQGGDNHTYQIACQVLDLGLSPEKATELMLGWNEGCSPPWDADELAVKIESAARYRQNDIGSAAIGELTDVAKFAAFADANRPPPMEEYSAEDMDAREPHPVQEIIPGWLERGISTFLVGVGGVNKSRLALQWGMSIATGTPIWGKPVVRCPCVYLNYEDDIDEVTRRWHAIRGKLNLGPMTGITIVNKREQRTPLAIISESGADYTPFYEEFKARLIALPGHKVVIVDSCYNGFLFTGHSKVNETCVGQMVAMLDQLCRECDCTIIILWHPSSAGQEDGSGWSEAWKNAPRARLGIKAAKDGEYVLSVLKRNHGAKGERIALAYEDGAMVLAARSQRSASLREAVVKLVETWTAPEWRIKRTGVVGAEGKKMGADHMIMAEIERITGVRYSVDHVLASLATALELKLIGYQSAQGGRKGTKEEAKAGYVPL